MRDLSSQFKSKAEEKKRREKNRLSRERAHEAKQKRQEKEQSSDENLLMAEVLVNQIAALEATLEERYGEDFAENLAAEHLDEKTFKALMGIEDQEKRRHAIAIAIGEGISSGTIDPNDFADPDIKQWLKKHDELSAATALRTMQPDVSRHLEQNASIDEGLNSFLKI